MSPFFLMRLASKNILRRKSRTLFISFSVIMSSFIAIWVMSFFAGINFQIEKAVTQTNTGYFQLQEELYSRTSDSTQPETLTSEMNTELTLVSKFNFSPELILDSHISTPEGSQGLIALGIVPQYHEKLLDLKNHISSGEMIHDQDDYVLIGHKLAQLFDLSAGDSLVLNYQDIKGELRSELLIIKGIYKLNSETFQKRHIYLSQKKFQELYFLKSSSEILFHRLVFPESDSEMKPQLAQLAQKYSLILKDWRMINPEMSVILDFHHGMIQLFIIIIAITLILTILTPIRMLWDERMDEFRSLCIIGLKPKFLWKLGFYEAGFLSIISFVVTAILLYIVLTYLSTRGIDFRPVDNTLSVERAGIDLPSHIYPLLQLSQFIQMAFLVLGTITLSYLISIRSCISKLKKEII